ncbi:MAG: bifunctional diaminohydroxyphosphoribosylaminopyrimidine deaminase/5-amino-6-(5-phosphoribosylamino)uracil reductase RibD [Cypionkella sp.]|uniref:bifunctional diaminohydroxyphosphoribosylaminopyrimidine deaminase/5-amino-6-(5-phosphoribosylamino)uracil reductase RibD n=1 Tax=Cypionkella sp. TaxID=2811411 RepID=UPI002AB87F66|nr:bifunctional diaminohydroxyphosphoribosylaminopyrimidine deaminase/5-amino-6-(5-phosphoribosylamino)uracil reductase RibD [Cypionkella sp.]MDZ4310399.1 bifunctional diaminohydroxyphosphoribosylaminopyrimidine deaminase/5-amino-6-(5-phosphoribosylamino)uracil reductase RibD [Cypionkella sp.]
MAHALRLAARGLGRTWPNPAVGCVIVKAGVIVGRGWTQPGGRPHAEVMALAQAGDAARGATAYVTLEPCAHHGKTPPCASALIAAGVARMVSALQDPDPRVSGKGHTMLRAAGIEVTENILQSDASRANAGFLKRVTQGLPFVTLKLATTLDGRIATASGESRWITGPAARRAVHTMRLNHDAVLIGSGTARADDPDLTVRELGASHQPIRIVMDSRLSHSPDSRLGQTAKISPVWLLHGPDAPQDRRDAWAGQGATLLETACENGSLNPRAALQSLTAQGLTRIFCEGGGTLAASLIRAKLVDDLALFTAGALIGADGQPSLAALNLTALKDAPRLTLRETKTIGPDAYSLWSL